MRRVVVTGMGMVTPLGDGVDTNWRRLMAAESGIRAIQAVSNGIQMLSSGFTIVRDMGNNGHYADIALRKGIEQGWVPGPTIIPSGLIIGGLGGQFSPTPEMAFDKKIVYPEYLEADTRDEIIKAVRQNALVGAKVIKICVDCKPWGYTTDEIRLFIGEAAKAGLKVEGHVQTPQGARNAVDAGIWSIAHDRGMSDEIHKIMAQKHIFRAGTETPISLTGHTTPERYKFTVEMLKNAWQNKVPLTFSTDADYYVPGSSAPPEIAVQMWNRYMIPGLVARMMAGQSIKQALLVYGGYAVQNSFKIEPEWGIPKREVPAYLADLIRSYLSMIKRGMSGLRLHIGLSKRKLIGVSKTGLDIPEMPESFDLGIGREIRLGKLDVH